MLEIRPTCEHCNKDLPFDSEEAMICTFECTFCSNCAENVLLEVCPNCGGGFEKRPIRPKHLLEKYPVSTTIVHKPVNVEAHLKRIKNR
ncbi:MAG: DUF1272 domain-containing protein [Winogradskyella sp.]|uniref:DUF1272 domain-containing protein n=1 Tax=Winogradskyella sp. TaxID=1883156 RepID=UPI000F3B8429|nr:DUF1272 domain-containing protein [Winogradskyella sp.]RNC87714.1 MAG: DUF1272 domain-containing protein [Winogradskyella sp.]